MPRKPDSPCAGGCGRLLWRGRGSRPIGQTVCLTCRNPSGHGASRYDKGCRCDECRAAKAAKQREYATQYRVEHGVLPSTAYRRANGWPGPNNSDWCIHPDDRMAIYERDDWMCGLCGECVDREWSRQSPTAPTLDHIIPRSRGGGHGPDNLTTAHAYCNAIRQDRDFTEFVIWAALEKTTLLETLRMPAPISR